MEILKCLKVHANKGPPVYFKEDIRNANGEKAADFGWEIGSLLHSILGKKFKKELYFLKSDYWRSVMHDTGTCGMRKDEVSPIDGTGN